MAGLDKIKKNPIKLLYIGDSSAGKTGSLCSLAVAGYNLYVLDIDKGSNILAGYLTNPESEYYKKDPEAWKRVDVIQVSDSFKNLNGVLVPVKAGGWPKAVKLLTDWKDEGESKGNISSWGEKDVLVIDSMTGLAKLALHFHLSLVGGLGQTRTQNEARRDMGAAQNYIRNFLDLLYDEKICCNIIVVSHITTVSDAGGIPQTEDGTFKDIPTGFPSAIGRALSPHIPRWFNNMVVAKATVQGTKTTRKIFTNSQYMNGQNVSAKTSAPLNVAPSYPIETGLADLFRDLKK